MNEHELPSAFFEMFYGIPRQGPGSRASTLRALSLATDLPAAPAILDVGCGTGGQTLVLADALPAASLTAIDNHAPFVELLRAKVRELSLQDRLRAQVADMAAMPFEPATFDLIWSEGAIYNVGFEEGLEAWRPLLRGRGIVAVSDAVWLVDDIPEPCRELWKSYPGITNVEGCRQKAVSCGYDILGEFIQPASDWDDYYAPIEKKLAGLRSKYAGDSNSLAALDDMQAEMDVFRRYSDVYSYVFFVLRAG